MLSILVFNSSSSDVGQDFIMDDVANEASGPESYSNEESRPGESIGEICMSDR